MKTIKNVQLIALVLVALNASGINMIPNPEAPMTRLEKTTNDRSITMVIKNSKGKIIYEGVSAHIGELPQDFDLTSLPNGQYSIEHENGVEINVCPFRVSAKQVSFDKSYRIYKPVILIRDNRVYVTKMSFDKQNLELMVYNNYNELVYAEKLKNSDDMGRILDFSGINNSKMEIVVKSDGRSYSKSLKF